jgi:hypothetical protein
VLEFAGNGFMDKIMSYIGICLGDMEKLNPFLRSWRVGGSRLNEDKLIIVEG